MVWSTQWDLCVCYLERLQNWKVQAYQDLLVVKLNIQPQWDLLVVKYNNISTTCIILMCETKNKGTQTKCSQEKIIYHTV